MICEYDQEWEEKFKQEKWLLREVLGEMIVAVHHVGSTAVPGLKGRPIVDLAVESTEFPPGPELEDTLRSLEYEPRHDHDTYDGVCFAKGHPQEFSLYWHPMYPDKCEAVKQQLAFRDLLRNDPDAAMIYGRSKQELSQEYGYTLKEYELHKGAVIEALMRVPTLKK